MLNDILDHALAVTAQSDNIDLQLALGRIYVLPSLVVVP